MSRRGARASEVRQEAAGVVGMRENSAWTTLKVVDMQKTRLLTAFSMLMCCVKL